VTEKSFLDKAKSNVLAAELLIKSQNEDDELINLAGYHLQQAVELLIKHQFEQCGVRIRGHEIETLIRYAKENNISLVLTDYIIDHAEQLTAWEAKTRYVKSYLVERRAIENMLPEIQKSIALYEQEVTKEWEPPEGDDFD
jgi:HEPN domain-containing protein